MSWTIKGASGASLDATSRTLEELQISSGKLDFQSLAMDSLTWTAAIADATGSGTIVPDLGQVVELYSGSTRKFKGHVTAVRAGLRQMQVTVAGPWWWMDRTPLTQNQTDATGGTADRASYVFPTGNLTTMLTNLINRAIANGVPMALGTIATTYSVPKISLNNMTCAAALAELMRWVPDAVAWFDYSGMTPTLNISRRKSGLAAGSLATTTLTLGSDPVTFEGEGLSPRLDLEVARVDLNYVTRQASTGKPQWANQGYGTAAAGKNQIVTVSGPEIVDFLPKDDFDSVQIQTSTLPPPSTWVKANDSTLAGIVTEFGHCWGDVGTTLTTYTGSSSSKTPQVFTFPAASYKLPNGASYTPTSGQRLVISPDMPDWAKDAYNAVEVQVTGTWIGQWKDSEQGVGVGWDDAMIALRDASNQKAANAWETSNTSGPDADYRNDWCALIYHARGFLIDTAFTTLTTVYKPWDYDYLTPPAGLAQALKEAQDWVPWEGSLTLVADDVSGDNLLSARYNLANALAPCATMATLARGVSHDIVRGRTTLELGSPSRTDFGSLVARIRREPADNIVYL